MDFVLITSLLNTLEYFDDDFIICCDRYREIIKSLYDKIRNLQAFLEDSRNNNISKMTRRALESEIRGVARNAEDKIEPELHQLYLMSNKLGNRVEPLESLFQTLEAVRRNITSIEGRIQNMCKICRVMPPESLYQTLKQVKRNITSIEGRNIQNESKNNHSAAEPQRIENIKVGTFSKRSSEPAEINAMVGCDDQFDTIVSKLTTLSEQLQVISVVGMGGIGKTTLIKKVFEDATIATHFDVRAWATVSQKHNLREMLIDLLGSNVTNGVDNNHLANQLRQKLIGQRYLIVMDDIWDTKAWDDIHRCFPEDLNRSRILLTTRLKQVADYSSSASGVFPEDSMICVKKLIMLWVAEGFLKLERGKTMEKIGETYLQDLVDRGLVQIVKWSCDGNIKSCKLHDLLHNFCLEEARREKLLDVINENNAEVARVQNRPVLTKHAIGLAKSWIQKLGSNNRVLMSSSLDRKACRWINNQSIHLDSPISISRTSHQKFRSILYFPKASGLLANYSSQTFPSYPKLLRVLDLSLCDLADIPNEIVNLVSLRYLALRTNAPLKDYKWSELLSLQTFIFETIGPNAPGEVWKSPIHILNNMPQLRHVMFSKSSVYLPQRARRNLQTISCLYHHPEPRRSSQNFINISNVKKLGIYIDITPASDPKLLPEDEQLSPMDASQQHSSLNDLVYLQWLENLKIDVPKIIHFQDTFRLPTSFPPNLKKLTLQRTCLSWDYMAIIATLPNLVALKLKHKAFCGSEWKTTVNGFCKLKYLKIAVLDFEHWSASFPVLECLILDFCRKLKKFPIGFADITTLQLIELTRCNSSLVISAKQIHEEQLEYLGYTKLVIRDYCTLP